MCVPRLGALSGGWHVQIIEKLRNYYEPKLAPLSVAARAAVIVLACVVVGGLIFWLCNELVYFYMARSYSEGGEKHATADACKPGHETDGRAYADRAP
jgi:hypothetical protein